MQNITDLEAWKLARQFRKDVSLLCESLPKEAKYRLVDQLLRASRSISANIAAGYGRFHFQENIQYNRQARGSLIECYDHFTCALDEEYIRTELFDSPNQKHLHLLKVINGYIAYLKKRKSGEG
jgi:four helix bundle protein